MSISHILESIEKARESYKLPPQKFLITQREYDWLISIRPNDENIKAFMDEHYTVVMPYESVDTYINEKLRDGYLERLGSLAVEQGFRVAPNPEVPGLRGLGHSFDQVYIDEPFDSTAAYDEWSGRTSSAARMEYGMLRGRNVWISIPGVTQSGPTCLSAAVIEGHPRIEVKL